MKALFSHFLPNTNFDEMHALKIPKPVHNDDYLKMSSVM